MKKLVMSYSMLKTLFECEGMYYWRYVRDLEKIQWKMEFLMGEIHHLAVQNMSSGVKDYEKKTLKIFDSKVDKLRQEFSVSIDDERDLVSARVQLQGMMRGYSEKYRKDLKLEKHIANEKDNTYPIPNVENGFFRIKLDRILEIGKKWYVHELKAWKSLKPDIINNTRKSLQLAIYFYIHNAQFKLKSAKTIGKPFSGVVFDAILKPSIRKKNGESDKSFLKRLEGYYTGPDSENKFYKEVFDRPDIPEEKIMNSIVVSSRRMRSMLKGREPMLGYQKCAWCDYEELCMKGEKKEVMVNYRKRRRDDGTDK